MTLSMVGPHNEVRRSSHQRLPTASSAVCRCGAVYDNGNLSVPVEYAGLCGRCAYLRDRRQQFAWPRGAPGQ